MDDCTTDILQKPTEQKPSSPVSEDAPPKTAPPESGLANVTNSTAESSSTFKMVTQLPVSLQQPEYRYKIYKYKDLKNLPSKKWLVQGFFGPHDIGIFFGPPGRGKTSVILNMMVNMNLGQHVASDFEVKGPLKILYCAGEGGDCIRERIEAAASHIEETDLPNISVLPSVPQLYSGHTKQEFITESVNEFIQNIKAQDETPDVLIIDTLHSAAVGAKENDSTDMGIVLHNIKHIAKELGCTVLLIHHTTKDGENFRGSGALEGDVDLMVKVDKTSDRGNSYIMKCIKLKDGKNWGSKNFNLTETGTSICVDWFDGDELVEGRSIKDRLLEIMKDGAGKRFTTAELGEKLGKEPKQLSNELKELFEKGKCKRELEDASDFKGGKPGYLYSI